MAVTGLVKEFCRDAEAIFQTELEHLARLVGQLRTFVGLNFCQCIDIDNAAVPARRYRVQRRRPIYINSGVAPKPCPTVTVFQNGRDNVGFAVQVGEKYRSFIWKATDDTKC